MNDLIKREDVLKYVDSWMNLDEYYHPESEERNIPYLEVRKLIEHVPTVPVEKSEVIRCRDCKWWVTDDAMSPFGYCYAIRHGYTTKNWDIIIRRKYKDDFFCADAEQKKVFCADAEPKEEGEEYD